MLKIKSLNIHMFRFYEDKQLSFVTKEGEIAPLVLITGGNGKGKTSIMNAIEWCITGDIKHLNTPYKLRIKGDTQKSQSYGLLRNKNCKKTEETWVALNFDEDGTESTLRRSTTKNELGPESTTTSIISDGETLEEEAAQKWLVRRFSSGDKPFADFFYKYFICDSQKAEDFRCKSRKDMTIEFDDFTLEHSEAKQVLVNLEQIFGNAFLRKDIGSFHCYFVDDITNSMDDINLVSFVDLVKYQLMESRKGNVERTAIQQFFFSTCDGNLKRMFQYKMDGFEIPVDTIDLDIR